VGLPTEKIVRSRPSPRARAALTVNGTLATQGAIIEGFLLLAWFGAQASACPDGNVPVTDRVASDIGEIATAGAISNRGTLRRSRGQA
jgi:hypothetical protein